MKILDTLQGKFFEMAEIAEVYNDLHEKLVKNITPDGMEVDYQVQQNNKRPRNVRINN